MCADSLSPPFGSPQVFMCRVYPTRAWSASYGKAAGEEDSVRQRSLAAEVQSLPSGAMVLFDRWDGSGLVSLNNVSPRHMDLSG